jgi:spoIIIJ-associated protein
VESLEITAKTVDEAIAKALAQLGKKRDEVDISILSEGSRGIFGIGGEEARILVSPRDILVSPRETEAPSPKPTPAEVARVATEVVQNLLWGMGLDADVEVRQVSADAAQNGFAASVNVVGEDLGILIGRRGETLSALQFITNLILGKRLRRWAKVQVDVESYRVRREQTLRGLAQRVAARVQETGLPFTMEAMPPNERRIVHIALADNPAVTTQSHGEGDQRRVVVSPRG